MRHQQDKSGKQQQAEDAELNVRTTLQELVPSVEVLSERHQQNEHCGENQDGTAANHAPFTQTPGPFRILSTLVKIAAQSCTTQFLQNLPRPAFHESRSKNARVLSKIPEDCLGGINFLFPIST
jgi:hypothetical protein